MLSNCCNLLALPDLSSSSEKTYLKLVQDFFIGRELGLIPCWKCLFIQGSEGLQIFQYIIAYCVELSCKGIKIHEKVDSSVRKRAHAPLVVSTRVHVVYSDGIGTEVLHLLGVKLALVCIDERVVFGELVGNA